MNVISKRVLLEKAARHPDARAAVQIWFDAAEGSGWSNLEMVRESFPATDMAADLAILNIRGV
ncbi:MAG: type II toxin-antitoxin system HigB family toxin [Acidobacteria bacterium]|nr:type II toxin-antitoxin system HigB family toxin [Acidobacteriota bacterium]